MNSLDHYLEPYNPETSPPRDDCYVIKDGAPTNADFHEEWLSDEEANKASRRVTYEMLKRDGCPEYLLKAYL